MQTSDFILIGDSVLSELTEKLSTIFSEWSENWFSHEVSFRLCRFEDINTWSQYNRITLTNDNIYAFSPDPLNSKGLFFQEATDRLNNIDAISNYFLGEAFNAFSAAMNAVMSLENITDFSVENISSNSGFIVIDIMIGCNNFRILFKETRSHKAASLNPSIDVMSMVLNRRTTAIAAFKKSDISISDLYSLKIGDVIKLNHLISEPLQLCRNEKNIGKCHIGTIDDYFAIEIVG